VGFLTLFERKLLRLTQARLGPNKVLAKGTIQPVLDGVKLFKKFRRVTLNTFALMFMMVTAAILSISILL
jgi:NADH:ubiquinone oxidoreductase subunit H